MAKRDNQLQKTKLFWVYFIASALLLVIGIFLLPVWNNTDVFFKDWSSRAMEIIIAGLILLYVGFYLIKNFNRYLVRKSMSLKIIKIVEISLLVILSVLCILEQFGVTAFMNPCFAVGLALYLRGIVMGVGAFLYLHGSSEKYSIFHLVFTFVALTLGTIMMIRPFSGNIFMWVVAVSLLVAAVIFIIVGILTKPKKEKKKK